MLDCYPAMARLVELLSKYADGGAKVEGCKGTRDEVFFDMITFLLVIILNSSWSDKLLIAPPLPTRVQTKQKSSGLNQDPTRNKASCFGPGLSFFQIPGICFGYWFY
jgi:hypothetical protein